MIKKFKFRNTRIYTFFLCLKFNIRMKIGDCLQIIKNTGNYKYDFDKNKWIKIKNNVNYNLDDYKNSMNNMDFDKKENKTKSCLPIK